MQIRITVTGGTCSDATHAIGDEIIINDVTPAGFCIDAWDAISSYVNTLRRGGNFPWEKEKGVVSIHCPDPDGIIIELRRID